MIDQLINEKISSIQTPLLNKLMILITNIGNKYTILILSILIFSFLIYKKDYIKAKFLTIVIIGGMILTQLLKLIFQRARPRFSLIEVTGHSFPSGHATISIIFFISLIYIFKNKIKNQEKRYIFISINILLFLLIGFSRIYLNAHWLTDVLAGFLVGIIWFIFIKHIYSKTL